MSLLGETILNLSRRDCYVAQTFLAVKKPKKGLRSKRNCGDVPIPKKNFIIIFKRCEEVFWEQEVFIIARTSKDSRTQRELVKVMD